MPTFAVVGATGYLGGLILRELASGGGAVVAVGRDRDRTGGLLEGAGLGHVDLRVADANSTDALREALSGVDVAIGALGAADDASQNLVDAAVDTAVHLVDVTGSPGPARSMFLDRAGEFRRAGITIVPGASADGLLGDLLGDLAAGAVAHPREVHVASTSLGSGGRPSPWPRHLLTPGQRREESMQLGRPLPVWAGGVVSHEWPGEQRRLAWFPRPVGPAHAAAVAGTAALSVPHRIPGLRTVRTYAALSGWRAELLQLTGTLARDERVRRRLARRLRLQRSVPAFDARAARRWAVVAEAVGRDATARAWANGRDFDRISVVGSVLLATAIVEGRAVAGALPPSAVVSATEVMDALSERVGLRWSLVRPG